MSAGLLAMSGKSVAGLDLASLPTLAEVEAELYGRSLREFVEAAWHVVEPGTAFVPNWHIDAITEHLEAVTTGDLTHLLINIPPGHAKSLTVSVFWPSWVWTTLPEWRWVFASYAQPLSTRDSLKCRRIIQSDWYQERWGHVYALTSDQNAKILFENNRTGYRIATSVGGIGTGARGTAVVADDPHNVRDGESTAVRNETVRWWLESMSTRVDDPQTPRYVVIMQRVHDEDVSGAVLAKDLGYEHLMLPGRYEPDRACVTSLGFRDPRTGEGELLWPALYDDSSLAKIEKTLGPYGTAGQIQQRPTARKGGQFERDWFKVIEREEVPHAEIIDRVRYWDKAGTEDGGAYTAGVLAGVTADERVYVLDVARFQKRAGDREKLIHDNAQADAVTYSASVGRSDKLAVLVVVEQEPGSGGKDSAEATLRHLVGYRAEAETVSGQGNKFLRSDPLAGAAKLGLVYVVRAPWTEEFLREMEAAGPGAAYLDQHDAAAGAYNRLMSLLDVNPPDVDLSSALSGLEWEPAWRIS